MKKWNYYYEKPEREVNWRDRLDTAWGLVIWVSWICIFFLLAYTFSGILTPELGPWIQKTFDTPYYQQQRLKNRGNENE